VAKKKAAAQTPLAEVLSEVPTSPEAPRLEAESPHRALARANARHAKLTDELRTLKYERALENIRSQQLHMPILPSKITHLKTRRRELRLEFDPIG
jgi:hypothetical protein